MIFLSAQPDDTYFIWQLQVLMQNLKELGVPAENIHILVSYKENINPKWIENRDTIYGTVHYYKDERNTKYYLSSIRPHIIKKFYNEFPQLVSEYAFYHDSDILFHSLPFFEGMEDGRVHVSRTNYIDYDYIAGKKSRTLIMDMINVVGIDEGTLFKNQDNTGGAQYYFRGLGYGFWDKVERECELMYHQYNQKIEIYRKEFFDNVVTPIIEQRELKVTYKEWRDRVSEVSVTLPKYDFQIWTTDMWVVLWNIWAYGIDTYANPILDFAWPGTDIKDWGEKYLIFHNSGVTNPEDRFEWFYKHDYQHQFPYGYIDHLKPQIKFDNGHVVDVIQQVYIEAIKKTGQLIYKPKKPIIPSSISIIYITKVTDIAYMKTVLDSYVNQSYRSKELIIFNIKDVNLELPQEYKDKGIRLINAAKSPSTGLDYNTFDDAEFDVKSLAYGNVITRWYNQYYEPDYITRFING